MNFVNVTPVSYETNSVTGTLPDGKTIVVSARQSNVFTIRLVVTIDGAVINDNEPTDADKEAFFDLKNRAWNMSNEAISKKRADAVKAAKAAGIF